MLRTTLFGLLVSLAAFAPVAIALEVGQPAPDFTLQDLAGTGHTLSSYRGKVVLVGLIGHG